MNGQQDELPIATAASPRPSSPTREVPGSGRGATVPNAQPNTLPLARSAGAATRAPLQSARRAIPVTIVTTGDLSVPPDAALLTIEAEAGHDHAGAECLVCSTRGNVRVLLFELLELARTGAAPAFDAVIVDARRAAAPQAVIDALIPGRLPAFGMRDHTVARSFYLQPQI
jgi:hypothetical protein